MRLEVAWSRAAAVGEGLSELLWPTRCVGCDDPGELLCGECRAALPWVEQRLACPACGAPYGHLTCTECALDWPVRATVAACGFQGAPARVVTCLKDDHERRLAPVMAAAMACALEEASAWPAADGAPRFDAASADAVCFVSATAEAFARRGFDHMELVARALSRELGLPLADVLVRPHARDQRALGKADRASNLGGTMWATESMAGARLLVVDDLANTGASLAEAGRAIGAAGGEVASTCVFARVW